MRETLLALRLPPDQEPKATDYVEGMVAMAAELIEKAMPNTG